MNRKLRLTCAALLVIAAGAACGDDNAGPPTPGTLLLSLTTPAADDGAVLVRLTGPGITGVQPASSSHQLFWRLASEEEARAIVIGGIQSGPLLTVHVPDVRRASEYAAELGEVAALSDSLRAAITGYSLQLTRIGAAR
ncbi:MAG TPA: hypothetical protein VMN60_07305 [Longimicrobiales bacterium]|nr:hypothetical protein [Longimicrobiales bacterium]